ncbi:hypothetical protein P8452_09283 [Trifolium repens]|nr:hypothetical protein P8452_09283 [Trifolium repens]
MIVFFDLQTPEVLELSKEIKEKLKEADKYDLEGLSNMRIQALEIVEEFRIKRADKQSGFCSLTFNEVCEEYFHSAKNTEVPRSRIDISENQNETYRGVNSGSHQDEQIWESACPLPPAH